MRILDLVTSLGSTSRQFKHMRGVVIILPRDLAASINCMSSVAQCITFQSEVR